MNNFTKASTVLILVTIFVMSILYVRYLPGPDSVAVVRVTSFPQEWYYNDTYECSPLVKALIQRNTSHPWNASTNFLSQGGEDRFVLEHFFHSSVGGSHTFLELGAYDGRLYSNSYFFEVVMGWKGILIEPSTPNYVELEKNRPGSVTLHMGVCERPQLLHVLGKGPMADTVNTNHPFHDGDHRSTCPCLPMRDILDMVGEEGMIDYLSLDVQGHEIQAIISHDWVRHPVRVLSIEQFIGYHEFEHATGRETVAMNRRALRERGMCRFHTSATSNNYDDEIWVNPALLTVL